MKVIIVDDEPKAIELLKSYLTYFERLELVATFRNGLKAFEYISKEPVDLILLDIDMPHISGMAIAKMIPDHINIIFTTAYSEFAVESYEVQALDYLLKPISLERFAGAIRKAQESKTSETGKAKHIAFVKSGLETFRLETDSILYLEKEGNYMIYHCMNTRIMARETIQEAIEKLPESFIQTHKSFIVNTDKILSFWKNELNIGKEKIPVSNSFRSSVLKRLEINDGL